MNINNNKIHLDMNSDNIFNKSSNTDLSITISSTEMKQFDTHNYNNINLKEYSKSDKKIIASKIEQIKHKKIHLKIFKIIYEDENNYTLNTNGVFLNINNLKNSTLAKIENILNLYDSIKTNKTITNKWSSILQTQYDNVENLNNDDKLSNYEKSLVKKQQNYLNDDVTFWGDDAK